MKPAALSGLVLLLSACGSPQRPINFVTPADPRVGVDVVARVLAREGQPPARIEREANIVETEWRNTGYLYGQIQQVPATIVRRFVVTLTPAGEGTVVDLRMDGKRCPQGGYTMGPPDTMCEDLGPIPDRFQLELDALGAKLQQALSAAAVRSPPPPPADVPPPPPPAPPAPPAVPAPAANP